MLEKTELHVRRNPEKEKEIRLHFIEELKKRLNTIINSLPCEECKTHASANLKANQIYESSSFLYIFHFFIELRNGFYPNKIDRSLFNTEEDIIKNKEGFFSMLTNKFFSL